MQGAWRVPVTFGRRAIRRRFSRGGVLRGGKAQLSASPFSKDVLAVQAVPGASRFNDCARHRRGVSGEEGAGARWRALQPEAREMAGHVQPPGLVVETSGVKTVGTGCGCGPLPARRAPFTRLCRDARGSPSWRLGAVRDASGRAVVGNEAS